MEHYRQISTVSAAAHDMRAVPCIQGMDDGLLDLLVQFIIQRIDLYCFPKDFLKLRANFRNWKCDDGKTALFSYNILVYELGALIIHGHYQLLLFP